MCKAIDIAKTLGSISLMIAALKRPPRKKPVNPAAPAIPPHLLARCAKCRRTARGKVTKDGIGCPISWRDMKEGRLCDDCLRRHYKIRAIAFKLVSVTSKEVPDDKVGGVFRKLLDHHYRMSTRCYRTAWEELARADKQIIVMPTDKLRPMPKIDLYRILSRHFGHVMPAKMFSNIGRAVQAKFQATRLARKVNMSQSDVQYRFPQPVPIDKQSYALSVEGEAAAQKNYIAFSLRDPDTEKMVRFSVQMAPNTRYRTDPFVVNRHFRELAENESQCAQTNIMEVATNSDHDADRETRKPGGGSRKSLKTIFRVVGYLPTDGRDKFPQHRNIVLVIIRAVGDRHFLRARLVLNDQILAREWFFSSARAMPWMVRRVKRQEDNLNISMDRRQELRTGGGMNKGMTARQNRGGRKRAADDANFFGRIKNEIVRFAEREGVRAIVFALNNEKFTIYGKEVALPVFKLKTLLMNNDAGISVLTVSEANDAGINIEALREPIKKVMESVERTTDGGN